MDPINEDETVPMKLIKTLSYELQTYLQKNYFKEIKRTTNNKKIRIGKYSDLSENDIFKKQT